MKVTITFESNPMEMARMMKQVELPNQFVSIEATQEEEALYQSSAKYPELITADLIIGVVARHFLTSPEQMKGKSRERHICEARFTAMRIIKDNIPGLALKQIGGYFGNRDHSSVIHAVNTHADLCKMSWEFAKKYKTIRAEVDEIVNTKS